MFFNTRGPLFIRIIDLDTEVDPMSIIFNSIQNLTICLIVDLQEHIYIQVLKIHYPSTGEAGPEIVDFLDFFIDIFLEVPNEKSI